MPVHSSTQIKSARRRAWFRGLCVAGTLALVGIAAISGTAQDGGKSPSGLFRVPNIFRSSSREVPEPAAAPEGRFVRRARQLIADAQQLEASGHVAAALDMARRADKVLSAASRTVGAQWPAGQRTPAEYVAILEQKVTPPVAAEPQLPAPLSTPVPARAATMFENVTPQSTEPVQSAAALPQQPTAKPQPKAELLLDWGDRAPAGATFAGDTEATESADSLPKPIQLLAADDQPNARTSRPQPANSAESKLLEQLRSLETWGTPRSTATAVDTESGLSSPVASSPRKSASPGASVWQADINDQNVGPIPTQAPHSPFDNGAEKANGPQFPEPPERLTVDYPSAPTETESATAEADALATKADTENDIDIATMPAMEPAPRSTVPNETSTAAQSPSAPTLVMAGDTITGTATSQGADSNLLITAAIQVLATFVGVLLAILVFRAVAIRIWGPGMGILVPVTHDTTGQRHSDDSADADVVPFPAGEGAAAGQTELPDPTTVPFRLVGSTYEDERLQQEQADREREEAILKTVFDQNINLIEELQEIRKSA